MKRAMTVVMLVGAVLGLYACGDINIGAGNGAPTVPDEPAARCQVDDDCLSRDCNDATGFCRP